VTIGGNGPVIEAGFAAAAAAFALDGALRAGVFRTTAALVPAWVRRPAGAAEDAGFGLLEALLPGVLRAAGAALVVLVNCRVAIE
jgi:hypothetical protein